MATTVLLLALASTVSAQYSNPYSGYGSGSNPYTSSGSGSSSGTSSSGYSGYGSTSFGSLNFSQATTLRLAHGVMASLAFVIFFPFGAISIRLIPGRVAFWLHVVFQVLGYLTFIAAFGIGVVLAKEFTFGSFSLVCFPLPPTSPSQPHHRNRTNSEQESTDILTSLQIHTYHPIIGIVVLALLIFQPLLGYIHHLYFKRTHRRTAWSYAHIWLGRIVITIGIINGGLGLKLANNSRSGEIAYGIVAGIIWLVWMAAAVYGEIKKARLKREGKEGRTEVPDGRSPPYTHRPLAGHRSTSNVDRQHTRSTRSEGRRRSSSRTQRSDRPAQVPLMAERGPAESGESQVREFYGGNQRERTWV
jgi:hypothetical protein